MTPTEALTALAWAALNYAKASELYAVEYRRVRNGMTDHQWSAWVAAGLPDERYGAALTAAAGMHLAQDAAAAKYAQVCGQLFRIGRLDDELPDAYDTLEEARGER